MNGHNVKLTESEKPVASSLKSAEVRLEKQAIEIDEAKQKKHRD